MNIPGVIAKEHEEICSQCEQLMEKKPLPDDFEEDNIVFTAHWICRDCHVGYVFFTVGDKSPNEK